MTIRQIVGLPKPIQNVLNVLQVFAIALVLCLTLLLSSAIAAKEIHRASVVLDGQQLFQVSSSGKFSAQERAETVNSQLQTVVQLEEPFQVTVTERNNLATIVLNDRHLLTVTERDALLGRSPEEQAEDWAQDIKVAIRRGRQSRTPQYLRKALLLTIGIGIVALGAHLGLGWFWRRSLRPGLHALLPDPNDENRDIFKAVNLLLGLTLAIARATLWLAAILYITNLFPLTRLWGYRITSILAASFISPILTLGDSSYSVIDLTILAGLLFCLVIFSRAFTDFLKTRVLHVTGVNRGAQEAVAIILHYSLVFIGALVLLQVWGLDISSLAILASALGVGIGFGLQDIAKNFGSGLVLVFERPIQVGDFVEVGTFQGTVERIGARSTIIRTLDQLSIIVPNSRFLEEEVINWNHDNPISRLHLPVHIAYGSDVELVRSLLLEAAKGQSGILSTPKPQVFLQGFGDNGLDLELLVWIAEPSKYVILKSELYFRLEALLRQHQIEIPFPQRDLRLRTGNLPIELSPELTETFRQFLEQSINGQSTRREKSS